MDCKCAKLEKGRPTADYSNDALIYSTSTQKTCAYSSQERGQPEQGPDSVNGDI